MNIAPNGLTLGSIPAVQSGGGERGFIAGWSAASSRSNLRFLQSIRLEAVGLCWGASLTVGDVPAFKEWAQIRYSFLRWLRRTYRPRAAYWLMEFQKRGAPHLHLWVLVDATNSRHADLLSVVSQWRKRAASTGAKKRGQHIAPLDARIAWARYLAKHMARGRAHYQREQLPDGWKVSGRVWGRFGDWPTDRVRLDIDDAAAFRIRRALRNYVGKRHAAAGGRVNTRNASEVRGASVWMPENQARRLFAWAVQSSEGITEDGEIIEGADRRVGCAVLGGVHVPRTRYVQGNGGQNVR